MGGRKARRCLLSMLRIKKSNDIAESPSSKTNASAPSVDEDGFTMVSKHNKRGPIKLQSKKQKPVRVKMHAQQYGPGRSRRNIVPNGPGENQKGESPMAKQQATRAEVNKEHRVAPIAPKKVTSGFNYSRAVQGGQGISRQQRDKTPLMAKPSVSCVSNSQPARLAHGVGSAKPTIGLGLESANRFSVLDIPSSIKFNKLIEGQDDLYPLDNGLEDGMDLEMNTLISNGKVECSTNEKYGISDAQKQCMEMGLDPENSILYPEEDTEIEDVDDMDRFDSTHAVSRLVVTKSPNPVPFTNRSSSRRFRTPPPATFIFWFSKGFAGIASTPGRLLQLHSVFLWFRMPRKKDPPPSSLPPRRSTRGASKSTSLMDGEDAETPMVPLVGIGETQVGNPRSPQQPFLPSGSNMCHVNKEVSIMPSVTERDYPRPKTVFSLRVPLSGEVAPSPTVSEGESVSQLPDMHVHVPGSGLETEAEVHGIGDDVFPVRDGGMHASTKAVHVGLGELPMQPDEGSRFFEPPDPGVIVNQCDGEEELGEQMMEDLQADGSGDVGTKGESKLSPRLTRLLAAQGSSRYRLRNDEDKNNYGHKEPKPTKPKLQKPKKGRKSAHPYKIDKENCQVNMKSLLSKGEELGEQYNQVPPINPEDGGSPHTVREDNQQEIRRRGGPVMQEKKDISRMDMCMGDEQIVLNTEYRGDSILDNISVRNEDSSMHALEDGEEQKVNSDQSFKQKSFTKDITFSEIENGGEEVHEEKWNEILACNRDFWEKEANLDIVNFHNRVCRVEKRKTRNVKGNQELLIIVERGECTDEKCKNGREKKNNIGTNDSSMHGIIGRENNDAGDMSGNGRKKIKIWSSKNTKPEKNLSKEKIVFRTEFVLKDFSQTPVILIEFTTGVATTKANNPEPSLKVRRKADNLLEEIRAKEKKLEEIAKNINATEENTTLINSILGMTTSKITKFSAHVNKEGRVTIDENMIENSDGGNGVNNTTLATPQLSYANMVTGDNINADVGKVKFYPPLVTREGNRVAVIEPKYILQAKAEYRNVLYGHFIGTGPSIQFARFNLFKMWKQYGIEDISTNGSDIFLFKFKDAQGLEKVLQLGPPISEEELANDREKRKTGENTIYTNGNTRVQPKNNDGFTLVQRRKGKTQDPPKNSKANQVNKPAEDKGNRIAGNESIPKSQMREGIDKSKEPRGKNLRDNPKISVIETNNRYELLDEDDMEVDGITEKRGNLSKENDMLTKLNAGWIQKQERNLNINFNRELNQDQRIEVKRRVKDKKLPSKEVRDGWPVSMLDYFRQLSSLYCFSEGMLLERSDKEEEEDQNEDEKEDSDTNYEEMESETEGMAGLMKSDNLTTPYENYTANMATGLQVLDQPDRVMDEAVNPHVVN
ncbi:hypothetical protein L1987_73047 [Smallanthus sonchifolius]|uniref:Uncharacterized protein n=1 Tax=Smallanthus sonchifolius TaxID=185202 RepID=A0ACB9B1B3_9ASTR|nr:hypothetical protein L1987_73047 [Smallanthus sonchifolius]